MTDPMPNLTAGLQQLLSRLPVTTDAVRTARSHDGLVAIDASDPDAVAVTIARELLPDPEDRRAVETAVADAVKALLGAGPALTPEELRAATSDFDEFAAQGKAMMEAKLREADARFVEIKRAIESRSELGAS